MTTALTVDAASERLASLRAAAANPVQAVEPIEQQRERHALRSLSSIADDLIDALSNTAGRYQLGLREIDWMTRGVGPGELMFLTGRSYSGKTNVFINSVLKNLDRRIVIITMDEPAEHVLAKLYALYSDASFEDVEQQVKARDPETIDSIRAVARKLSNVVVFDDCFSFESFDGAMVQAEAALGGKPDVVFIDYLGLLAGDSDDAFSSIENKARGLKRWAQGHMVPVICIHQGTRSNAGKGKTLGMEAMAYGGENEAFHIVGVRRKRDDESLDTWERDAHENTVSVSVIKSKRLPMRRGEFNYYIDPQTGAISEDRPPDVPARSPLTTQEVMGF